jgi:hypothetical protein
MPAWRCASSADSDGQLAIVEESLHGQHASMIVVAGWQVEFGEDASHVLLDGAGRNPELAGDSGVAMAFGQQREHFARSLAVSSASGSLRLRRANNSWTRARTEAENVRPWVTRGKVEGMMLRDVADLIEGVEIASPQGAEDELEPH